MRLSGRAASARHGRKYKAAHRQQYREAAKEYNHCELTRFLEDVGWMQYWKVVAYDRR